MKFTICILNDFMLSTPILPILVYLYAWIDFLLIIYARVYLLWEQENCYLVSSSSFSFFFPNNKREKGMKRKMTIVFLFHGNPFVEQPKCPIYQLNVTNIPYYKEDRKSEVKVGQFSLNVYWCFSIILRFILNIQDKYFSSVSEFCKCTKYTL